MLTLEGIAPLPPRAEAEAEAEALPLSEPSSGLPQRKQLSVASVAQHAFLRSALEKAAGRGRASRRSRTRDASHREKLESAVEQRTASTSYRDAEGHEDDDDNDDVARVRRYVHEHCLDERLRLREALVVARLLGALQLEWPGLLFFSRYCICSVLYSTFTLTVYSTYCCIFSET